MANRPPRLRDFEYKGFNRYFLTVCVNQREPVFGNHELGTSVADQFLRIAVVFDFEVIAYCVMPDHFHALAAATSEVSALKPFMHRWKQASGYWWKHDRQRHRRVWQEGYYDRILRDDDATEGVVRYILENPVRAGLVDDAREYPLLGSTHFDVNTILESAMSWKPPWK